MSEESQSKPIGARCIYALMGFLSAGALAFLIACPLLFLSKTVALWTFGIGLVFASGMAIWGFIATEDMLHKLQEWWDEWMEYRAGFNGWPW